MIVDERARQRLYSQWTGIPFPVRRSVEPRDLRAVFQKVFDKLGLGARFQDATLQAGWEEVVGATLAAHCRPSGVRRGVLYLWVDHPAWLHQITLQHKADILRGVQQRFAHLNVKEINLRIG